eukprot:CAMPEP_0180244812 /NCGR_PEP_ID=MMETSP0987-20121128/34640_1 /TAXON_ID=697907 /ORGANISM="non described non described, Strain CCMP2293" /LENGTH=38 /DNA_ID= /DNA_START= /DNA_END= /DNA_ORIENTATION=
MAAMRCDTEGRLAARTQTTFSAENVTPYAWTSPETSHP